MFTLSQIVDFIDHKVSACEQSSANISKEVAVLCIEPDNVYSDFIDDSEPKMEKSGVLQELTGSTQTPRLPVEEDLEAIPPYPCQKTSRFVDTSSGLSVIYLDNFFW